jgi:exosortase
MQVAPSLRLWLIAILACVVALVYWPSSVFLSQKWSDTAAEGYTHGWLILLVCVALAIRARRELAAAPTQPAPLAHLALAGAILAWLVCYRASIESLEVALLPVIFWLAATAAFGWAVGRLLLFPAAYLYFALPIWYPTPLQDLTVVAMHGLLTITGPAALFTGDVIHIPNGTFRIEEGCSGVHFMIVGLAVAALYGEQQRDPWRIRAWQLALMAALAVLANWVRVYTVIEAGYLTDMQSYLVRVSHYGFGWAVFAATLVVFFWLVTRFGPDTVPAADLVVSSAPADLRPQLMHGASVVALLVLLPALSAGAKMAHPAPPAAGTAGVDAPASWHASPVDLHSAWLPVFTGADELRRQAFGNPAGATVEVLSVTYREQRQDAELVGETSSILGHELQPLAERVVKSASGAFRESEVADHTHGRSLIWWRYEVAGRSLVGPFIEQLWYGVNAIIWNPPAGLIALRTACAVDCDSARRTLGDFVAGGIR